MLTRLYADNYKCLVNFEFTPAPLQLIFGLNGTGKSTVFDILSLLRGLLIDQNPVYVSCPSSTLTRWQKREVQAFELDVQRDEHQYRYSLEVRHHRPTEQSRVRAESLTYDGRPLFYFRDGEVQLYRDDHSAGPQFHLNWNFSGLATVPPRHDNQLLTWFKDWIARLYHVKLDPWSVSGSSEKEAVYPDTSMSNFASWYRHLSQERPGALFELFASLRDVISGFDSLSLVPAGENVRLLKAFLMEEAGNGRRPAPTPFGFDELSEGQLALVVLYTLLHAALDQDVTLCIDEPDNFVALREIQPWLMALRDHAADRMAQVLLISHHPELIDYLAAEGAVQLERDTGPTRIRPYSADPGDVLKPSELVARGWPVG